MKNNEIRTTELSGMVRESFDSDSFREFINSISDAINDKIIFDVIKDGSATVVGTIHKNSSGLDADLIVKCFKSGGFLKTFGRRFIGSKAKSLFKDNSFLFDSGFNVPEPVCFIDLFGDIESCFISIALDGFENFAIAYDEFLKNSSEELAQSIAGEMNCWHNAGIVHGDMKWSNIMVDLGGSMKSYFIDLDQVSIGKSINLSGVMGDLTRFYRYGIERGMEDWVYNTFLPIYLEGSDNKIKGSLSIENISLRAMAEHMLKQ